MFIRSERLFLRPGWSEDWTELLNQIEDWAMVRQLVFMAETARAGPEAQDRCYPQFLVTLPGQDEPTGEGARLIGCVGLAHGQHGAELVYWIAPEYWGHGYATEAAEAVLSLARALGHRRITAIDAADDAASERILAKLGFAPIGVTSLRLCPVRGVLTRSRAHCLDLGGPGDSPDTGDARHAA